MVLLCPNRLREELLSGVCVHHADGCHRALLGSFDDDFLGVGVDIRGNRLAVIVQSQCLGGDADAHLVANAEVVVDRYTQFSGHVLPQALRDVVAAAWQLTAVRRPADPDKVAAF